MAGIERRRDNNYCFIKIEHFPKKSRISPTFCCINIKMQKNWGRFIFLLSGDDLIR